VARTGLPFNSHSFIFKVFMFIRASQSRFIQRASKALPSYELERDGLRVG
jgi:hypothetical protein